jgi:hypothetical protein
MNGLKIEGLEGNVREHNGMKGNEREHNCMYCGLMAEVA